MKGNTNKSLGLSSDDILLENNNLKTALIKTSKQLKNYEDEMIIQFIKIADQVNISKPGLIFQSPSECLKYFIKIVDETVNRNKIIQKELQETNKEIKKIKQKNEIYCKAYEQIKIQDKQKQMQIIRLQYLNKTQQQNRQKQKKQFTQLQIILRNTLKQTQQNSIRIQNETRIRNLQQRKKIIQKYNKDQHKYRLQLTQQINRQQKQLKKQLDKKDKQIKCFIHWIHHFLQKTQKQQGGGVKYKVKDKNIYQAIEETSNTFFNNGLQSYQNNNNIQTDKILSMLQTVIKPFAQHTTLLDKISQYRKQNNQLKTDNRKNNTTIMGLQSILTEKNNDLQLMIQKLDLTSTSLEKTKKQLYLVSNQLQKYKNQKINIDKYYQNKWSSQFNRLKRNLDKKIQQKYRQFSQQQAQNKKYLQIQYQKLAQQKLQINKQNNILKSSIEELYRQKLSIVKEKQQLKQFIYLLSKEIKENYQMHLEEIFGFRMIFDEKLRNMMMELKESYEEISKLKYQIEQLKSSQVEMTKKIKLQFEKQIQLSTKKISQHYEQLLLSSNDQNNKLAIQIISHKTTIKDLQRQRYEKIDQYKIKFQIQKQKQQNNIKLKNCNNNQKKQIQGKQIQQYQNIVKELKQINNDKQIYLKQKQEKQQIIINNISKIQQYQIKVNNNQQTIKNLQLILNQYRQQLKQLQLLSQSKIYDNQMLKNTLVDKQNQINMLIKSKKMLIIEIQECKKQFYKGINQIQSISDKIIDNYKHKIRQLEQINQNGGLSKRDFERFTSLTNRNKQLQNQIALKQAQNLILNQIKQYYQSRSFDDKMTPQFQLHSQKQIASKKRKRKVFDISKLKYQVNQDLQGFTGRESYEVKKINANCRFGSIQMPKIGKNIERSHRYQKSKQENVHHRANSSMA